MTTEVHFLFLPLHAYVIMVKAYLSERMERKKKEIKMARGDISGMCLARNAHGFACFITVSKDTEFMHCSILKSDLSM